VISRRRTAATRPTAEHSSCPRNESEKTAQAYAEAYRSCANRLTADGLDLGSYGIAQQVDDMEAARVALGYNRINLLSESAGMR
jgi:hypothetical protein